MTGILALSAPATIALVAGIVVSLAFVGGLVALAARRRGPRPPDIPSGMKPGPPDEVLERRQLEKVMGWGIVFTLLFAIAVAVVWLNEPTQNRNDEVALVARATHRGELWFQVASEENPTGFGCAQCHGEEGAGGQTIPFTTPDGEQVPVQPPSLNNVCSRLTIEGPGQIRETIMQGRPGTAMPSWSVRFAGPMNDQQIQDLINYIVSLNEEVVPPGENQCLNPPTDAEAEEDGGGSGEGAEEEPSPGSP
jgi:mono/diheme cytochrome c family protein